jgi:hypothetical protein
VVVQDVLAHVHPARSEAAVLTAVPVAGNCGTGACARCQSAAAGGAAVRRLITKIQCTCPRRCLHWACGKDGSGDGY